MRVCNEACKVRVRRNSTLYEMKKTSGQRYKKSLLFYCTVRIYFKESGNIFLKSMVKISLVKKAREMNTTRGRDHTL